MSGHAKTEVLVSEIPFLDYVHAKNLKYWLIGQRILQPDGMDSTNYIWDKVSLKYLGPFLNTLSQI